MKELDDLTITREFASELIIVCELYQGIKEGGLSPSSNIDDMIFSFKYRAQEFMRKTNSKNNDE